MAAVCAGLAGSSAAAERARPWLAVTAVGTPPDRLEAGKAFGLPVKIRNKGRAGTWPRLVVRLRREGVNRGLLRRTLKFLRPGFGRPVRPRVEVPATIPAATYAVLVCVRRRGGRGRLACRAAGGKLRIEARSGPPVDPPLDPRPGSRSLGDALFPEIGNGGYDARHYEVELVYDPATNALGPGTATTMTARATHDLSQFSLDLEGLNVDAVSVDGEPAAFERVAPAACSASPPATSCGPTKLVVDLPDPLRQGREFTVRVDYTGVPKPHVDPDESIEGWIRACSSATNVSTCDGAFVVNQPVGAMTWFPSNNHPADKARFKTVITAPSNRVAIGIGELASQVGNANGTTTWNWVEDDPTATYLTTATVGAFDLSVAIESTTGQQLPVYTAIDSGCDAAQKLAAGAALGETPSIIDFFNDYYGPYPFDSTGGVVDRITGVSYALEVQTKPHYARCNSTLRPTVVHELAHQWFGNAVTLATWSDIWFNEGWAQWSDWFHSTPGTATPAVAQTNFQTEYNDGNGDKWKIAPAVLDGDPKNLFAEFPTYTRGAMTLEGYREIVGDGKFFEFAKELLTRFRYGNVTTRQVIDLALEISDFTGAQRTRLADYFEQWLYGETKPQITPQNF